VSHEAELRAVEEGAGLFHPERALLEVRGGDRVRWLNGMLSNDVEALAARGPGAGCHALLLTREGRVVADFRVLLRDEAIWLEGEPGAASARERLEKFVIADDVTIADRTADFVRLAVEGPAAPALLAELLPRAPAAGDAADVELSGVPVVLACFSLAGGPGFQIFAARAEDTRVTRELLAIGAPHGLRPASTAALECLRIEAGVPRLGHDLDETVLPDEARLDATVSTTKGCYTGQEVVARMRSRGRVSHLLVGLAFEGEPPAPGAPVEVEGRRVGEVTSAVRSPRHGAIALGYVRRPHDAPGTTVVVVGRPARVVPLPFAER
jgi:folate-binding protein YgfZ